MSYAASAVTYWSGQANDNSSNPAPAGYTAGQRWSATAAQWKAMYDAQVSQFGASLPPAGADVIDGTVINNQFNGTQGDVELSRLTVDRTGYWTASWTTQFADTSAGAYQTTFSLRFAGTQQDGFSWQASNSAQVNGRQGLAAGPILLSAGQTIQVYGSKAFNSTYTLANQHLRAVFCPTQTYPH